MSRAGPGKPADPSAFAGIAFAELNEAQQKLLLRLVNDVLDFATAQVRKFAVVVFEQARMHVSALPERGPRRR